MRPIVEERWDAGRWVDREDKEIGSFKANAVHRFDVRKGKGKGCRESAGYPTAD